MALWVVPSCPWCRGSHVHGAGDGTDPESFLGVSRADCGHGYELVAARPRGAEVLRHVRRANWPSLKALYACWAKKSWHRPSKRSGPDLRRELLAIIADHELAALNLPPSAPPFESD